MVWKTTIITDPKIGTVEWQVHQNPLLKADVEIWIEKKTTRFGRVREMKFFPEKKEEKK